MSYTTLKTYLDAYINTNNANTITGSQMNVILTDLLKSVGGILFDATRPYLDGNLIVKGDKTYGYEIWCAEADVAAAAWNASSFTRLTKRTELVTVSTTPYTGIELGTKAYAHGFGHVDFTIQAFSSVGALIPLFVTAKSTTTFTLTSNAAYANAKIYISEIIIS